MIKRLLTSTAFVLALTGAAGLGYAQTSGSTGSGAPAAGSTSQPPAGAAGGSTSSQDSGTATSQGSGTTTQGSGTTTTTSPPAAAPSATGSAATTTGATSAAAGSVTQQQPDDLLADRVIGMNVRNPQNDKIGTIHDLVMDKGGQVKAAVLSVGGFLGIGDKKVAVPWDQVQIHMEDRDRYASVNMNKEQLTQAPEFKTAEDQRRDAERATSRERATTPGAGSGAPAGRPAGGTGSPAR